MSKSHRTAPNSNRVLVIGAASLDIVGRAIEPPVPGTSTPASVRPSFGGVARNVAENLARLGQPVSLISAVGKDQIGQQLLDYTAAAGVDISACLRSEEYGTAAYLAVLDKEGLLQFALDDMRVMNELKGAFFQQHEDLFHSCGMVFLDANVPPLVLTKIFQLARQHHLLVCADAASGAMAARMQKHLPRTYMVTASPKEATVLLNNSVQVTNRQTALTAVRQLVTNGVEVAVIPLPKFGVCYASSETSGYVPSIRTPIVDPTGAGDSLTAAIIFGLMNDFPLDDAVRLGVACASLTLQFSGSVISDLSLEKLYDHMSV